MGKESAWELICGCKPRKKGKRKKKPKANVEIVPLQMLKRPSFVALLNNPEELEKQGLRIFLKTSEQNKNKRALFSSRSVLCLLIFMFCAVGSVCAYMVLLLLE